MGHALDFGAGSSTELFLRLASIPKIILVYIGLSVLPLGLHFYRSHNILEPYVGSWILLFLTIILVVLLLRSMQREERAPAFLGLGIFMVSILPTLNILPLVLEYSYIFTAEHFLYFPLIGLLIFYFSVGVFITRKLKVSLNGTVWLLVITVCFMVLTFKQNTFYQSESVLFERSLKYEPQLSRVHFLLAEAYLHEERFDEAIEESQKALSILNEYVAKVNDSQVKTHYLFLISKCQNIIKFSKNKSRGGYPISPKL